MHLSVPAPPAEETGDPGSEVEQLEWREGLTSSLSVLEPMPVIPPNRGVGPCQLSQRKSWGPRASLLSLKTDIYCATKQSDQAWLTWVLLAVSSLPPLHPSSSQRAGVRCYPPWDFRAPPEAPEAVAVLAGIRREGRSADRCSQREHCTGLSSSNEGFSFGNGFTW